MRDLVRGGWLTFVLAAAACGDSGTDSTGGSGGEGGEPSTSVGGAGGSSPASGGHGGGGAATTGGGGSGGAVECSGPTPSPGGTDPDAGTLGVPQVLATDQSQPGNVIVDDAYVYWVTWEIPGAVRRVPKAGGEVESLAEDLYSPWDITQDATALYWGDSDLTVRSVSKAGGCVVQLAAAQDEPQVTAVDDTHVYWVASYEGAVRRVPKTGGEIEDLATGQNQPFSVAVDDTHVYWSTNGGQVQDEGGVYRAPKAGGEVEPLASGITMAWDVELVGDQVFWFNVNPGTLPQGIHQRDKSGGTPTLVGWSVGTYDKTVDELEVFTVAPVPNKIEAISRTDGSVRELASEVGGGSYLTHDATHVYWSEYETGRIMRTLK